jgi:hypothetical protein
MWMGTGTFCDIAYRESLYNGYLLVSVRHMINHFDLRTQLNNRHRQQRIGANDLESSEDSGHPNSWYDYRPILDQSL